MTSYCRRPANFGAHERATVGDTKFSFTNSNHLGWMKCDASWLNKTDYGLLFNVIGGTFGETSTQFRLPDPRGRVIGAVGTGPGLTPRAKGDAVGEETHTLIIEEMPGHKHGPTDLTGDADGNGSTTEVGNHSHTGRTDAGGFRGTQDVSNVDIDSVNVANIDGAGHTHDFTTNPAGAHTHYMGNTGGDLPHNNMQPTLFYGNMFIYCGKVNEGAFPYTVATDLK